MDIMNNMKSILKKISFCILTATVFCVSATEVAHAKTVTNNYTYIDSSRLDFFNNIYMRSNYKSYLLATEITSSGYNNYTSYYYCLSNDIIDTTDTLNTTLNCDKLYRYVRNSSNEYVLEPITDTELKVIDSIYYSNSMYDKGIPTKAYLLAIIIGCFTIWLTIILFKVFGG